MVFHPERVFFVTPNERSDEESIVVYLNGESSHPDRWKD